VDFLRIIIYTSDALNTLILVEKRMSSVTDWTS